MAKHIELLTSSYTKWTGKDLIQPDLKLEEKARNLFYAPFALLSHDTQDDPVFNYANLTALELFEFDWENFTKLHSRKSAEPIIREERQLLLKRVTENGFIDDYNGIRISSSGKRFKINNATVWNLIDEKGIYKGQAAAFSSWEFI
ncbi:MAG: MEKHLA domain-containing protein [Candidatus Dadabacteria bacterium]|nr:MEKHLA domain-containing protein [Candidatus Dadabacteria bacterium]NIQ13478.1 MEKHLA domain-containing protein [Candidatus Dadabacteria bacterium]